MAAAMPGDFAEPGQRPVEQRDQRDERQQHRADVQREAQTVAGAGRRGVDDVGGGLLHFHLDRAARERLAGFRDEDLRDHQRRRRGHDRRREQVLGVEHLLLRIAAAEHADIGGEHAAGDVRHAADHHRDQFRLGHLRDVRAHGQRRLGLADEHAGADAGGLRARDAHDLA